MGTGRGAIDFVEQETVGEDRAGFKVQAIGSRDSRANEVRWKEVWVGRSGQLQSSLSLQK